MKIRKSLQLGLAIVVAAVSLIVAHAIYVNSGDGGTSGDEAAVAASSGGNCRNAAYARSHQKQCASSGKFPWWILVI